MSITKNWADLEVFTKVGAQLGRIPFISITKRKEFSISAAFISKTNDFLGENHSVILSYSRLNNAIVFNFLNNKGTECVSGIKITFKQHKQKNGRISAVSFFNYYKINMETVAGKYVPVLEDIPNIGTRWIIYIRGKK